MLDLATRAAQAAGAVLMERFGRLRGDEIERHGARDVVTAADHAAERVIADILRGEDPDIPILGEEGARASDGGRRRVQDGPLWIVDPLDGTVNYIQGLPLFAVSIGLVEDGAPVLGVVHAPALGATFHGAPGAGAFENGRPMSTSITPTVEEAVVATGFAYGRGELEDDNVDNLVHMVQRARGIRRFGAAALDLAYVAAGRLDGFFELHLSPWDVAAGAALVRAAGGVVTDFRGGEDWLFGGHIVASGPILAPALRAAMAPLKAL